MAPHTCIRRTGAAPYNEECLEATQAEGAGRHPSTPIQSEGSMNGTPRERNRHTCVGWLLTALVGLLLQGFVLSLARMAEAEDTPSLEMWLKPQDWRRDRETLALLLGEAG